MSDLVYLCRSKRTWTRIFDGEFTLSASRVESANEFFHQDPVGPKHPKHLQELCVKRHGNEIWALQQGMDPGTCLKSLNTEYPNPPVCRWKNARLTPLLRQTACLTLFMMVTAQAPVGVALSIMYLQSTPSFQKKTWIWDSLKPSLKWWETALLYVFNSLKLATRIHKPKINQPDFSEAENDGFFQVQHLPFLRQLSSVSRVNRQGYDSLFTLLWSDWSMAFFEDPWVFCWILEWIPSTLHLVPAIFFGNLQDVKNKVAENLFLWDLGMVWSTYLWSDPWVIPDFIPPSYTHPWAFFQTRHHQCSPYMPSCLAPGSHSTNLRWKWETWEINNNSWKVLGILAPFLPPNHSQIAVKQGPFNGSCSTW